MIKDNKVRSRGWQFTWFHYTEETKEYLRSLHPDKCSYVGWGDEIAPSTGEPHLQGYTYFSTLKSFKQVRALFPTGQHLTPTGVDNGIVAYCSKDGTNVEEHGERPMSNKDKASKCGQATKAHWEDVLEKAKAGDLDSIPAETRIKHYRVLKEIHKDYMKSKDCVSNLENEWISGPSGCGKTSGVLDKYPDAYLKTCNKWWDGYQDEETVLIDDIDETHTHMVHNLKIWGDHKPFLAETKGGMLRIRPKRIICTSNVRISDMTSGNHLNALKRRYIEVDMYDEHYSSNGQNLKYKKME